jgi:hypothetical protein
MQNVLMLNFCVPVRVSVSVNVCIFMCAGVPGAPPGGQGVYPAGTPADGGSKEGEAAAAAGTLS